jgi:hypothetical protein
MPDLSILALQPFFKVVEWEWAWDFLDNPLYSFLDVDKTRSDNFRHYMNSSYSKDGEVKRRMKEVNGKQVNLSKGRQQSFAIIYDKGKKIENDREITRLELRQQGKHKKDLSFDLLAGDKEDSLAKAIPTLKKSLKKVIHQNALQLTDYWLENAPKECLQIFVDKT